MQRKRRKYRLGRLTDTGNTCVFRVPRPGPLNPTPRFCLASAVTRDIIIFFAMSHMCSARGQLQRCHHVPRARSVYCVHHRSCGLEPCIYHVQYGIYVQCVYGICIHGTIWSPVVRCLHITRGIRQKHRALRGNA